MHINSRLVSSTQKREIMWNIIEPGDPYDIRKSMIAKLPGRKNFMGDHLELVCLLQAAEIERISEYLEEYKLKFWEIERRELDRHSYQIQIKQLTMQLSEEGTFKMENLKLKDFLRKQTIELEEIKKKSGGYEIELSRKYEDSLRQIESLLQENQLLKSNSSKLRVDFQQALTGKSLESEQLQRRLKEVSLVQSSEYSQKSEAFFKMEIEYKKLDFQNKRVKEMAEAKNREIEDLQNKSRQFIYQLEETNAQLRQYSNINHTISEYENRFALLGQEIERLNLMLREKTGDLSEANNSIRMLQEDIKRKAEYVHEIERKKGEVDQRYMQLEVKMVESMQNLSGLDESRSLVKTYEYNLEKLSSEIERLNSVLRKKVQELEEANRKKGEYEYEMKKNEVIRREVDDYRIKYGEFNKKVVQYQNKIALFSQQIERLNQTLRRKEQEAQSFQKQYKSKNYDLESYQQKIYQLQVEYTSEINRLGQLNQNYESKINQLTHDGEFDRQKIQELVQQARSSPSKDDARVEQYYQGEIDKLNQVIQSKTVEIQRFESEPKFDSKVYQTEKERIIQQYELELRNRNSEVDKGRQTLSEYEARIINSAQEIERLSNLLKRTHSESPEKSQLALQLRKVAEYENKLAIRSQQIERLNDNLRARLNDKQDLEARLREYEHQLETSRRKQSQHQAGAVDELERKLAAAARDNDYLKEEVRSSKDKLARVSGDNKHSSSSFREHELKGRQLAEECRLLAEENSQVVKKVGEYEFQMGTLSSEIHRLNNILRTKVEHNTQLEQQLKTKNNQLEDAKRRTTEYQGKISQLKRQIDSSKESLTHNSQHEIENLKRKLSEAEGYISQYESRMRQYEEQVRTSMQERQSFSGKVNANQRKFGEYENKIVILSQQIERLNELLARLSQENSEGKRKIGEIDYLKMTIVTLEERFSTAVQENDELRRGVSETNLNKNKLSQDFQQKFRALSQQNDELARRYRDFESNYSTKCKENEYLNSTLKLKVEELSSHDSKLRTAFQDNETLSRKIQELTNSNRKIAEYDSKITILSHQIQRLNNILKAKLEENKSLEAKCRHYEQDMLSSQQKMLDHEGSITRQLSSKITFISQENDKLRMKLKQVTNEVNKIPEFESKFAMVYGQVERLNTILRTKTEEGSAFENKQRNAEQQIERYSRRNEELENTMHRELKNQSAVFEQRVDQLSSENDDLRKKLREASEFNRRIAEYENKSVLLTKEIERLNELLVKYSRQVVPELEQKLRNSSHENDDLRRKVSDNSEVSKSHQQLMSRFKTTSHQNEQFSRRQQDYESRMAQISGEVDRLNTVLKKKIEQLNESQGRLRQALAQNDRLEKRLRESSQVSRRVPEYESKMTYFSQQIERLNSLLKTRVEECLSYDSELRRYKGEYETVQRRCSEMEGHLGEHKSSRTLLEQQLGSANKENDQLRRIVRELSDSNRKISDYESRMALLSQQIERLNLNLRGKTEEKNSVETSFKNYKRQSENKISNLSGDVEQFRRKVSENMNAQTSRIAEYENKMLVLSQEIERLNYVLKEHTYGIEASQKKESQYLSEIERLNNTLRLKVEETTRWEQASLELKAKLKSYEDSLQVSASEFQKLKQSHSSLSEEYTKANKHLVEYEQSINKLYQEFERLQSMMQEMKKENYELKTRLQDAGNLVDKNRALSAEIDRLTKIMDVQRQDLQDLRLNLADQSALQKRLQEDMAMMVVLFAEIESLRKRVKDTEFEIESVRRSSLAPFKV